MKNVFKKVYISIATICSIAFFWLLSRLLHNGDSTSENRNGVAEIRDSREKLNRSRRDIEDNRKQLGDSREQIQDIIKQIRKNQKVSDDFNSH